MTNNYKLHKGVAYFPRWQDAKAVADRVGSDRIIYYLRGWAVQYRVSGPYYPEHDLANGQASVFGEAAE